MAISHIFTNPVPDGTITSIVRPSDWNSAHNQYYTLSGNVLGASTVSGTNVVLQAGTNISLSGTGQTIVIQGTNTPQPTSYVSNVNGISGQVSLNAGSSLSASTNGSSITFGLASNITTALQSANSNYLTTQSVQTQPSGAIAGTGFTSTTTAGTAVTGALGTNGINLGIPAYLTTYTVPTSYVSNVNGSSGAISLNVASSLSASTNGSSITFGLASNITTALQSANANYLTSQSNQAFSASGGSSTFQTLNFANSNGVTFSNSGGSIVASYTVPTQSVQTQASGNIVGSGFTSTTTTGTAVVGTLNSSGLSLGVPAFITAGGVGGNFSGGVSNLGNTAGSTGITGTRIVFVGTNNISLSQSTDANGATISINQTGGGGGGGIAAAAGGQTATSGTVNFANSNGITFGMSQSSQITASYTVPSMQVNLSGNTAGNSTASGNTLNFSGINVTLSGTNNSQIAISAPATSGITAGNNISLSSNGSTIGISAQAVALGASTQTATSGTVNFANSNGISFGMSGSNQITASYTVPTQSVQTQASGAIAGTGFTSTTTVGTAITAALGTNGLNMAVPAFITAGGGGGNFSGGVSNLGNTAGSTGITGTRIIFVGTNNISLSQSTDANGATISINQTGGGGGAMYANLSGNTAGNTTASGNTLNFSGINVTLSGTNNSQIAISAPATTALVAGNNISLSANANTLSVLAQAVAVSAGSQLATSGTLLFSDANGFTFGMNGSSRITLSARSAFSAAGGSSTISTLNFISSNGITFTNTNGSIAIVHDLQYTSNTSNITANAFPSADTTKFAGTGFTSTTTTGTAVQGTLSTNGLSLAVPAFITAGGGGGNFSGGVSNLGNTAGSTGITGTRIVFVGTNNISLSQSTDANGATISINQTGGGGGGLTNINVSAGTTSNNLSNIVFSNTNGVSFGLNGSTVTASVAADYTMSGYYHYNDVVQSLGTQGNGTLCFDHVDLDNNVQFDRFGLLFGISNATNSTGSHTVSVWVGLYTQNASSISRLTSTSTSFAATQSGTVGSYSLYSGVRQVTIPITTTLTKGEYIIGVVSRTSSAGANGSYSMMLQSNLNSDYRGFWGSAVDATNQIIPALGHYSTSTTELPVSVAYSQIRGTNANAQRPPIVMFHSGTF